MQPTTDILARIRSDSFSHKDEVFTRLFRYLLRPDIYFVAYKNLYANNGSGTKGVNDDTADGFSEAKIARIVDALKNDTYFPAPVRRTYIAKKNNPSKKRPLGIPTFTDKLVNGSKEDAESIKRQLAEFICQNLKMELSDEKTLITHSNTPARFLGYDVRVRRDNKKLKPGGACHMTRRSLSNMTELNVPFDDKIHKFLFTKGIVEQKPDGTLFPIHRKPLVSNTDLEIIMTYNAELRGICNYYSMASNFSKLSYFAYLMEYSCLKTLAAKHKCNISKIKDKFGCGKSWGIPYDTRRGPRRCLFADYMDCKKSANGKDEVSHLDIIFGYATNTIEKRLKAKVCELCGRTDSLGYEIHHVNKVKNLKGKEPWERAMIAKRRKTLVVCEACHNEIHRKMFTSH